MVLAVAFHRTVAATITDFRGTGVVLGGRHRHVMRMMGTGMLLCRCRGVEQDAEPIVMAMQVLQHRRHGRKRQGDADQQNHNGAHGFHAAG